MAWEGAAGRGRWREPAPGKGPDRRPCGGGSDGARPTGAPGKPWPDRFPVLIRRLPSIAEIASWPAGATVTQANHGMAHSPTQIADAAGLGAKGHGLAGTRPRSCKTGSC